ncbi:MAG: hypothetical protein Kow0077_01030 [Anaerolineae bacterium]
MYTQNELLYPHHVTRHLRNERGPEWQRLIDRLLTLPESHPEVLALNLMMIQLNGCLACETDSYRAMRGCRACSEQTLRRFKGTDEELLQHFYNALDELAQHMPVQAPERELSAALP